jgi:hypothetical protein
MLTTAAPSGIGGTSAGGQQPGGVAGVQLVVGEDVVDQAGGRQQVGQRQAGDHGAGDDPRPGLLPVDAARVPDDQGGQQAQQHGRGHLRGVHPVLGGQCDMQGRGDDDRQRRRAGSARNARPGSAPAGARRLAPGPVPCSIVPADSREDRHGRSRTAG